MFLWTCFGQKMKKIRNGITKNSQDLPSCFCGDLRGSLLIKSLCSTLVRTFLAQSGARADMSTIQCTILIENGSLCKVSNTFYLVKVARKLAIRVRISRDPKKTFFSHFCPKVLQNAFAVLHIIQFIRFG